MPKTVPLLPDATGGTRMLRAAASKHSDTPESVAAAKPDQIPLQVRLPREAVRSIKVAAAERDLTISDFMLSCFRAYMKSEKNVQ